MSCGRETGERAAATRFVEVAQLSKQFQKAPSLDRQRFRRDLDKVLDQDVVLPCSLETLSRSTPPEG